MKTHWGIDLGGTKIEGVVLEEGNIQKPLFRSRIPTEADKGYEHIVGRIEAMVREMQKSTGLKIPESIGIGTPGTFDPFINAMKNCNTTALNGKNLPHDLGARLSSKVIVANDANCFALAEALYGAGRGAEVVFGVIMGTGVGGGIVVNGKVLNGAQGIAGEWGHNVLDANGEMCYSGIKGCVESFISGPALEKYFFTQSGERRSLKEIVDSRKHNPLAEETLQRLHHYFGRALASIINLLDPNVIVLGGGVGNIDSLYIEGIEEVKKYVFNHRFDTVIKKPELGDSAGVFGAAFLS
ncbi:MAG: ROK family protein [Chloroherpetonaceae bacterium]|nr:ROK family protein [Chloroherpetonaceae bacterium]